MILQEIISESQQAVWFNRAKENEEEHYIYSQGNQDVGLLSLKPSKSEGCFEAGIFCGEPAFLGHSVNFRAVLWLYDLAFGERKMEFATVRVNASNVAALRLNKFIGFRKYASSCPGVVELRLERKEYLHKRRGLPRMW